MNNNNNNNISCDNKYVCGGTLLHIATLIYIIYLFIYYTGSHGENNRIIIITMIT